MVYVAAVPNGLACDWLNMLRAGRSHALDSKGWWQTIRSTMILYGTNVWGETTPNYNISNVSFVIIKPILLEFKRDNVWPSGDLLKWSNSNVQFVCGLKVFWVEIKMLKNMHRMTSIKLKGNILEREKKRVKWNMNEVKISSHEKRMKISSETIQNIFNENLLQQRRKLV